MQWARKQTRDLSCCESSNVVLLVKLQGIPCSQIGRIGRMERAFMRSPCPPGLCQMNLIFPQADQGWLLILKKAMSSLLSHVHYAKFIPGAILLTTILLLHGWACFLHWPEAALPLFHPGDDSGIYFLPYYWVQAIAHITEQIYFMTFLKLPGKLQLYFCNQAHNDFLFLFMTTGITADEKFGAEHTHLQPPELKILLKFYTNLVCFYNICLKGTS